MQRYQSGYASKYNANLAAKGRTFSSMITGGSNFPTRRHEKANQAEQNRYDDMKQWDDRAQSAILRELKKSSIEEAGGELEVMKKKIADAEKAQENYKKINTILRKKNVSDDAKVQEIMVATGYKESTARNMFKQDFAGRTGTPSYILTNNNANIRRMHERIKEMEKKEATPTKDIDFAGGTIVDNAEADRIQIFFDNIPPNEIRTKLKGSGWKWSPNAGAWQRMRTEASRNSAKQITGAVATTTNQVQGIKQELKSGEIIEVPEVIILGLPKTGLPKKGILPDPDWEFEKQEDERIKRENEREVNPDDYYRDYETEKDDYLTHPDDIHQWMESEVKKEITHGSTVVIPEFVLITGERPTGKVSRFEKGKEYIGIKYMGKNFKGEWEKRMEITKHHGRPYSVAEWDSIIEYTPEKWAELKEIIQKEADANNRDAQEDSLNSCVLQTSRWTTRPKPEKEIKYKDIEKGETVIVPEATLKQETPPPPQKEPYEMTADEFWRDGAAGIAHEGRGTADYNHKLIIKKALSEGKIVPVEVLKDYPDLSTLLMKGLIKDLSKGETVDVPETVIEKVMEPTPTIEGARWRKFSDHKSETKAVKEALDRAGIEAEVGHGRGTGWGWLEINIGDPGLRGGVIEETRQYTHEEQDLHKKVMTIAKEVTGRHGEYDGNISLMAQDWRTKVKKNPPPSKSSPAPGKNWLIKSKDGKFTLTIMYGTEKSALEYANKRYSKSGFSLHEVPPKQQYTPKISDAELEKAKEEGKKIRKELEKGEIVKMPESKLGELKQPSEIPDKSPYGKEYPRYRMVRILVETDKNGKTIYYETIDPTWKKRISLETVNSLKSEGRAFLTGKGIDKPISKSEFYEPKYWIDPKTGRHPASGSGRLQTNQVPFLEVRDVGGEQTWYVRNPYTSEEYYYDFDKLEDAKKKYNSLYDEFMGKDIKKELTSGKTVTVPDTMISQIKNIAFEHPEVKVVDKPWGKIPAPKFMIGEKVYSWQNPSIPAEIRSVNLTNEPGYDHTYILRLLNEDGSGTHNSKYLNESGISRRHIKSLSDQTSQIIQNVSRGEIVEAPKSRLIKQLEAPPAPLSLYPSSYIHLLEKGETIDMPGTKLDELLQHQRTEKKPPIQPKKTEKQKHEKATIRPCIPPVHVHAYDVPGYTRKCPTPKGKKSKGK